MSLGLGHVQTAIVTLLHREGGPRRPRELAAQVYSVGEPTLAQTSAVRRALGTLKRRKRVVKIKGRGWGVRRGRKGERRDEPEQRELPLIDGYQLP